MTSDDERPPADQWPAAPPPPSVSAPPYGGWQPPAQPQYVQGMGDERTWAAGAHAGSFLAAWIALGVLAPVFVLAAKGNRSAFVRHHAYESLNFQLNTYMWLIAAFLFGVITLGIGWASFLAVGAWYLVFVILAAIAANRGEWYRYPLIIRFLRP